MVYASIMLMYTWNMQEYGLIFIVTSNFPKPFKLNPYHLLFELITLPIYDIMPAARYNFLFFFNIFSFKIK